MDKKIKNTLKGAGFGAGIVAVWADIKRIAKNIIR